MLCENNEARKKVKMQRKMSTEEWSSCLTLCVEGQK